MKKPARRAKEDLWLKRTPEGFVFASELDRDIARKWGVGSIVRADIVKPRSGKHNRWFHALLRVVFNHQEKFATLEALKFALKIRLKEFEIVKITDTETFLMPVSTSYDAMEEGEFKQIVEAAFRVIVTEIIPGMDGKARAEMEREVDALVRVTP